jgi:hypothetical protein
MSNNKKNTPPIVRFKTNSWWCVYLWLRFHLKMIIKAVQD